MLLWHFVCITILFVECTNGLKYGYFRNKMLKSFYNFENMALSSRKRNTNSPTAKGFKTTVTPSSGKGNYLPFSNPLLWFYDPELNF